MQFYLSTVFDNVTTSAAVTCTVYSGFIKEFIKIKTNTQLTNKFNWKKSLMEHFSYRPENGMLSYRD